MAGKHTAFGFVAEEPQEAALRIVCAYCGSLSAEAQQAIRTEIEEAMSDWGDMVRDGEAECAAEGR